MGINLWAKGPFFIYKLIISFFVYPGFKKHNVYPIAIPVDEKVELMPSDQGESQVEIKRNRGFFEERHRQ